MLEAIGLDLDAGIFVFGASCALPAGRTLIRSPLPPDLAARLVQFLRSRGFPSLILYDSAEAGFDYQLITGQRNAVAYETWVRLTPTRLEPQRTPGARPAQEPIRIGVIDAPADIAVTMSELRAAFPRKT